MSHAMSLPAPMPALLLVAIVIYISFLFVNTILTYRKLRHIPGPPLAAFSQWWLFHKTIRGDLYLAGEDALREYGRPARIGPNMIIHDDPAIARFVGAPRSPFRRGHWFKAMKFDPRINNLLSETDEKRHSEVRAKMMPGYTGREVPNIEAKIDAQVLSFVSLFTKAAATATSVDFAQKAQYFTLDSLTDIAFGSPFGFLTRDADLFNYNASSTDFFPILELGTNIPVIHSILSSRLAQALAGPKPEDKKGFGAIIGVAQRVIADRFRQLEDKEDVDRDKDMLDAFIKHDLSQLEAESESLLQILAGSDSTATTIRMTFLLLLTNPHVYIKLRSEVDLAVARGQISFPVAKYAEAAQLPYLQAVIKEGLRLWQPLNGLATKISPKEGLTINGTFIPGNTQVAFSQHSMMRRADLFGPDPEIFRPERWLDTVDLERIKQQERTWELSFGAGRFTCLGKGIALMEVNKVLVELLRRFDFGLVNPVNTMRTKCYQLHIQKDMFVRVWERTDSGQEMHT